MNNNNVVFKAKACEFNGFPGYMLCQYTDGKLVVKQFITETSFKWFQKNLGYLIEIE